MNKGNMTQLDEAAQTAMDQVEALVGRSGDKRIERAVDEVLSRDVAQVN